MRDIALVDLLKAGLHFGHQQSRRHPKMDPYIFTTRGGVSIINLEKTKAALSQATSFVGEIVASGGVVVFVATKRQARDIVLQAAQTAGMPYVVDRWIGGLFTNFQHVRQLIIKLDKLKTGRASGDHEKYTKKEQLEFDREIVRLEKLVGGLGNLEKLPNAIFVVDVKTEKTAVREANAMHIPVIAMCDTNVNPTPVQYCIPANDDATKAITYVTQVMSEAVAEGRQQHDQRLAAAAKAAADAATAVPQVA
ncbi:MAG: 30S ribosomal protein S2 [Candidatus Kerfeldbacteria bacterium]|nr:30S ribosomal protein S2 [Candidatus Kerfeldbacteria bacterium]